MVIAHTSVAHPVLQMLTVNFLQEFPDWFVKGGETPEQFFQKLHTRNVFTDILPFSLCHWKYILPNNFRDFGRDLFHADSYFREYVRMVLAEKPTTLLGKIGKLFRIHSAMPKIFDIPLLVYESIGSVRILFQRMYRGWSTEDRDEYPYWWFMTLYAALYSYSQTHHCQESSDIYREKLESILAALAASLYFQYHYHHLADEEERQLESLLDQGFVALQTFYVP